MLYDLTGLIPLLVVVAVLGVAGAVTSLAVLGRTAAHHRRIRVARQQSIPAYYGRFVLTH